MKVNQRSVLFIVLVVIVLLGASLYANRSRFSFVEDLKPIYNFEIGQKVQLKKQKNSVLALSREGLVSLSTAGRKQWNVEKQQSNPTIYVAGNYILLYDRGGTEAIVTHNGKQTTSFQTEQGIITAKVNQAGYLAVVSGETGYKSKIEVIDQQGDVVYRWLVSESYVLDVDISPDCKRLCASSIITDDNKLAGKITFVDLEHERIITETQRDACAPIALKFSNNGALIAATEQDLLGFDRKGVLVWTAEYQDKLLTSAHLQENGHAVLAFAGNRNNTILECYNQKGKKTGEYISESVIKSIDVLDDTIAVAEQRNILLLRFSGKLKAQKTAARDVRSIVLVRKNVVAILGGNTIELMKL